MLKLLANRNPYQWRQLKVITCWKKLFYICWIRISTTYQPTCPCYKFGGFIWIEHSLHSFTNIIRCSLEITIFNNIHYLDQVHLQWDLYFYGVLRCPLCSSHVHTVTMETKCTEIIQRAIHLSLKRFQLLLCTLFYCACAAVCGINSSHRASIQYPASKVQVPTIIPGLYWLCVLAFNKELCVQIASKQKSLSMKTTQSDYMLEETFYIS